MCQEGNLFIKVVKTSRLNEESCSNQSPIWVKISIEEAINKEVHRGEKSPMQDPSPKVSLHAFIVENLDSSRRIVDTLRRTKVPQKMLNLYSFMRRRAHQLLRQVKRKFCSFVSKQAQILQVKSAPG